LKIKPNRVFVLPELNMSEWFYLFLNSNLEILKTLYSDSEKRTNRQY
jgi:hypothetical protein